MAGTVKVTIRDGWAVFHDGEHRTGGTVVEVDNETAEHWIERGWASPGENKPAAKRKAPTRQA